MTGKIEVHTYGRKAHRTLHLSFGLYYDIHRAKIDKTTSDRKKKYK